MARIPGGLRRKGREQATPRAVLAASLPLTGPNAVAISKALKPGTQDWQKQAWYHYDACGEFRSAVTWIANAVSKADLFAAETDPETGTVTGPTEDARAIAAAATVLGGLTRRAQLLQTLAVHWQVPGESYIVVRPRPARAGVEQPDEWLTVSGTRVTSKGGTWQYQDPMTMLQVTLTAQDRLIRIWSPHPDDGSKADSAARPALPILREIEKSSQNIASKLDSRLIGNGILPVPQELDFPLREGMTLGESFADYLLESMEANLSNPGNAAAQTPIIAVMPMEMIQAWRDSHMDLSTEFDSAVPDLRKDALARLWSTLDMPNETAEGSTGGMNHWGAWKVEEDTYKIYIEPLLDRLGDAITHEWYWDTLRAMGESNPERFVLAWETSSIVSRPDRTGELKDLWDDVLISDDYRRAEMGIPDDAVPDEEERVRRTLDKYVSIAPTLLANPSVAEALNLGIEIAPATVDVDPSAAEVPAGEEAPTGDRALPAPAAQPPADGEDVPEGLVAAAEFAVFDALSRAGKRLLTREHRGQFGQVKAEELYLSIPYTWGQVPKLLEGSFSWIDAVADAHHRPGLDRVLWDHVEAILKTRLPYSRDSLRKALR